MATLRRLHELTPDGRKRLEQDPDRLAAVGRDVERFGGEDHRTSTRRSASYDFVTFLDAPDNAAIARDRRGDQPRSAR